MKVIRSVEKMQQVCSALRRDGRAILLVPTMGYLHEGHLSLIRLARERSGTLVVTIYVNPTQFAPGEDLESYPRDFNRDEALCRKEKVDIVFYPSNKEMYKSGHKTFVMTETLAGKLCGISRPEHFRGVTTVVAKLFNIIRPDLAVFGQKDAQQLLIIKRMVSDLNFDTKIIAGPIIRESDGLAISSRNKYLEPPEREAAIVLYLALKKAKLLIDNDVRDVHIVRNAMLEMIKKQKRIQLDYLEIVNYENLEPVKKIQENTLIALAAYAGKTRLIDNILI